MFIITNFGVFKADEEFPKVAEVGDILYSVKDNNIYEYYDEGLGKSFGWRIKEIDKDTAISLGLTEYDINKMVVAGLPSLITEKQLAPGKALIESFAHNEKSGTYFMLLCNDIHYYTVFEVDDFYEENIEDIVIECLQDIGVIQQINMSNVEKDAVECWVKNENGAIMFLFFRYDWGIVKCR